MASNLPPGVMASDIPGNTVEDQKWDRVIDWICETSISPEALQGLVMGWCKRTDNMPERFPPL